LLGSPVVKILDYKTLEELDVRSGERKPIEGIDEKSNVLQWLTEDGTKVSVRPSGTEPKIKFYFGVKTQLESVDKFDETLAALDQKIEDLKAELKLA
jgi:phosphoglucomutase